MKLAALLLALAACSGSDGGPGSGAVCGGFAGSQCPDDEFCDFATDSCGAADETGTCRARPTSCAEPPQPTCACDGKVYASPCEANRAGTDANAHGTCPGALTLTGLGG